MIYSNILNGSNNYSITSTNSASCDQVGVAIPTTYASLSGVNTGVDYNIGIETYLPKQGKFNIQFREMVNSSVLWTPSAGVMEDYCYNFDVPLNQRVIILSYNRYDNIK